MEPIVITPIRVLPGVRFMSSFFLDRSGTSAFTVDFSIQRFVQIDLTTGQQTVVATDWPKKFKPKKHGASHIPIIQLSASNIFIYSLFVEKNTNRIFIVTFFVNNNNSTISIIDEYDTRINAAPKPTKSVIDFQLEAPGILSCCLLHRIQENRTIFQSVRIQVNEAGKVIPIASARPKELPGNWLHSFMLVDSYYFLSVRDYWFLSKVLKVPCNNQNYKYIEIANANKAVELPDIYYYTPIEVIGSKMFFYAFVKRKQLGMLLILDVNERTVRKLEIEMNEHVIATHARLKSSSDGLLFLHGTCLAKCQYMAHIYVLDIYNEKYQSCRLDSDDEKAPTKAGSRSSSASTRKGHRGSNSSSTFQNSNYMSPSIKFHEQATSYHSSTFGHGPVAAASTANREFHSNWVTEQTRILTPLWSINHCRIEYGTLLSEGFWTKYYSCAIDSIIDLFDYAICANLSEEDVQNKSELLQLIYKCHQMRQNERLTFEEIRTSSTRGVFLNQLLHHRLNISKTNNIVWDWVCNHDPEHFCQPRKGTADAQQHGVPKCLINTESDQQLFGLSLLWRCTNDRCIDRTEMREHLFPVNLFNCNSIKTGMDENIRSKCRCGSERQYTVETIGEYVLFDLSIIDENTFYFQLKETLTITGNDQLQLVGAIKHASAHFLSIVKIKNHWFVLDDLKDEPIIADSIETCLNRINDSRNGKMFGICWLLYRKVAATLANVGDFS